MRKKKQRLEVVSGVHCIDQCVLDYCIILYLLSVPTNPTLFVTCTQLSSGIVHFYVDYGYNALSIDSPAIVF